jgi:type II secretory ATPase GspE/PulE/Tfp pilus assembly ATPase PilB-like protein
MPAFEPGGCLYCANRGYVGRLGVFELLPVDEDLARAIAQGAEESEIIGHARQRKVPRLVDDALEKVITGQTSLREALSAVALW